MKSYKKSKKKSKRKISKKKIYTFKFINKSEDIDNPEKYEYYIYTSEKCGYCKAAKKILEKNKVKYKNISIDNKKGLKELENKLIELNMEDYNFIPVILNKDNEFFGDYSTLKKLYKE